jgi:hypothetical protein
MIAAKRLMASTSNYLLALILLGGPGVAEAAQVTEPYSPQCDHDHIDSMVGSVAMSLGIERVVVPTMTCLLKLWREDQGGTTKYYESSAFLAIMDQSPQLFFASMVQEPKIFDEWLNRLQADSFSWPFDPPCGLDARREQLIATLKRTAVSPKDVFALKNAVITKLSSIRCRQIE